MEHIGTTIRSLDNDKYCGDQCAYWTNEDTTLLCMIDGLGHGEDAEIAAKLALSFIANNLSEPLLDIFKECDIALHGTRGAAMMLCEISHKDENIHYAGIGNIHGRVIHKESRSLACYPGIIGGGYQHLQIETIPMQSKSIIIMASDGVQESFELTNYSLTLRKNSKKLSKQIIKDWSIPTDDAGVIVYLN